jgi:hypothetical protein
MIEHLNWRSLADRRSDARLVMLYKITHELVTIPKTDIFIPPLEHALTLIPNTTNTLTTQTAIILSANYTKLEQPPLEHCEE